MTYHSDGCGEILRPIARDVFLLLSLRFIVFWDNDRRTVLILVYTQRNIPRHFSKKEASLVHRNGLAAYSQHRLGSPTIAVPFIWYTPCL